MVFGMLLAAAIINTASGASTTKAQFQNVQVMRFEVRSGLDFPADYLVTMMEDIVGQLSNSKKFAQVLRQGETPAEANAPILQLVGTVTQFNKGSRAMRYMVGFGAGKTKVKAHVKFLNPATNETVLEKDVDGLVWIGFIGGESLGATRGLAKEVAKLAKSRL